MRALLNFILPAHYDGDLKQCLARGASLARSYSHDYIGVEHVFLSLRDLPPEHPVATILAKLPVDVVSFWRDLEKEARVLTGRRVPDTLPFTPRLQFILRSASRVAKDRGTREVSLFHFVAAVALEHTSLVAQVLYRHLQIRGAPRDFSEASARMLALLIAFPGVITFNAQGTPNQNIADSFRAAP